ncbi:hypothetical protein L596_008170 [Steinernema carpocapsae]|uniref:DH domain-containing protein n=1 Tax=Steinernema carpocapsae TaxID=34508 RepID=A0A4U5PBQ7_STECR|nr:hypothetical protein L596_008170 [Steinernema carpocapsae]
MLCFCFVYVPSFQRQCQCYMEEKTSLLYLVSDANVFVARSSDHRALREFLARVLRNSTLRLFGTSTLETTRRRIQQMLAEHNKQLKQILEDAQNIRNRSIQSQVDVLAIRNFFLETRLASLTDAALPSAGHLLRRISTDTLRLLPHEKRLSALFLLYAHKITSLGSNAETAIHQILCASQLAHDDQLPSCSSSCRGSAVDEENKKMATIPDPMQISRNTQIESLSSEPRRRRRMSEYDLEKSGTKLGLTICAHLQEGKMVAEVTGTQDESSQAKIGDEVLAVDGTPISDLKSASEAEVLLRKGRILKMRRVQSVEIKPPEPPPHLADRSLLTTSIREEKLQKSICELVETEKAFVGDLEKLVRQYARAAQLAILESAEKLLKVQKTFLEDLIDAAGDLATGACVVSSPQVKDSMLRISALFVNKCSKFKVYSEYSAAYLRFQQTIIKQSAVRDKLRDLNESGQQNESVESLMIKPIQRVLKYPLFLEQMIQSCPKESVEQRQASQALSRMQALASYVNEMQRLQEEYGSLFEQIIRANKRYLTTNNISIDFSQLIMFAHLKWLNSDDKKNSDCVAFVFATLILICPHKNKAKNCRIIPIRDIEINESETASTNTLFVFVLIHLNAHDDIVYHLACCQAEIKTQFLKSVRKAAQNRRVEESAKRPVSGSSHSDGGYGSEKHEEKKF